ncbi:hypothetical protein GCM10017602_18000 [Herbiconiux flava]|nr:hypothetical protein GCM10017602_18000 [Herbiconiux flava]
MRKRIDRGSFTGRSNDIVDTPKRRVSLTGPKCAPVTGAHVRRPLKTYWEH